MAILPFQFSSLEIFFILLKHQNFQTHKGRTLKYGTNLTTWTDNTLQSNNHFQQSLPQQASSDMKLTSRKQTADTER